MTNIEEEESFGQGFLPYSPYTKSVKVARDCKRDVGLFIARIVLEY